MINTYIEKVAVGDFVAYREGDVFDRRMLRVLDSIARGEACE